MDTNMTFEQVILRQNYVILDTETTGLKYPAQIIEIAILDAMGHPLLDSYVFTGSPLPAIITDITGITYAMLKDAPLWTEVKQNVMELVRGKDIITYNAKFDRYMLHCTDDTYNIGRTEYGALNRWHCAMLWYADVHGDFDEYHGNNRWLKLTDACQLEGVLIDGTHRALYDCNSTYHLIRNTMSRLAGYDPNDRN